jgi:hypothetical protein
MRNCLVPAYSTKCDLTTNGARKSKKLRASYRVFEVVPHQLEAFGMVEQSRVDNQELDLVSNRFGPLLGDVPGDVLARNHQILQGGREGEPTCGGPLLFRVAQSLAFLWGVMRVPVQTKVEAQLLHRNQQSRNIISFCS